ncbi:tRNA (guanine-N(7)-)-methyltransferase [Firmicutes bacterium CAG:449]|nr:tRNA (guanine-N(7)-)-methyltransferase [Firmicutes bacterium CAG:449]
MRLRHRKWGDQFLQENTHLIKNKDNIDEEFISFINHENLRLEIGVGRGDFILQMALANPNVYFLGVEISGMALAIAGKKLLENEVKNVLLVNMDVHYLFEKMGKDRFDYIYLNFSDPWPKKRQHKRRLTYPTILNEYYEVLKNNGKVIFKTDNDLLFNDSVEYFKESKFVVESITYDYQNLDEDDKMTEYEKKFRGLNTTIKRIVARK